MFCFFVIIFQIFMKIQVNLNFFNHQKVIRNLKNSVHSELFNILQKKKNNEYFHKMKKIQVSLKRIGNLKNIENPESLENPSEVQKILNYLDLLIVQQAYLANKFYVFGSRIYLQNEQHPKTLKRRSDFNNVKSGMPRKTKIIGAADGKLKVVCQIDSKFNAFTVKCR